MTEPVEPALILPVEPAEPAVSAGVPVLAPRRPWVLAAGVALALAAGVLGLDVYRVWQGRARRELIARLERSGQPLSQAEIGRAARRFRGDRELLGASLLLAGDAQASDAARWNALLLESAVAPHPGGPGTIGQLDWKNGAVSGARLVDLTVARGHLTAVTFDDSTFAGVTWGAAFSGGRPGLVLNQVRFRRSRFESGAFSGTHLSAVEFLDSTFSGARLDLSNFDHVRFTRSASPTAASIVRGDMVNRDHAPPAGVDDLALPTDQVSFAGIAFDGVHFRGWIRPEWFSGCTFTRCVFPTALRGETLVAGHNTLSRCLWSDEPVD
jgi:hypothetical protein